jgi:predicted transcriptional regulator
MAEQKQQENKGIIFKDKQAKILLSLRGSGQEWYISSLAKATNTTYVHTCNFISSCESMGIIKSEKHGKIKVVKLTDKGVQLADMISGIYTIINSSTVQQGEQQASQQEQRK